MEKINNYRGYDFGKLESGEYGVYQSGTELDEIEFKTVASLKKSIDAFEDQPMEVEYEHSNTWLANR